MDFNEIIYYVDSVFNSKIMELHYSTSVRVILNIPIFLEDPVYLLYSGSD